MKYRPRCQQAAAFAEGSGMKRAACALGAYLSRFDTSRQGWNSFEILQGRAMGCPSRLIASAFLEGSSVRKTTVTGKAEVLSHESIRSVL